MACSWMPGSSLRVSIDVKSLLVISLELRILFKIGIRIMRQKRQFRGNDPKDSGVSKVEK